jgi:pimeloyl-ACP methyl ester carboxylesterase
MTSPTTTSPRTHTLEVSGALLTYDVRRNEISDAPPLMLIGSPMGAAGFGTLAGHFADRTVVTYDPRGAERSRRTDGRSTTTPEEHADDLSRIIAAVDAGPVDLFATSGGAINALALVARHPGKVRTLVAHEPPTAALVSDRGFALAACQDIHETYQRSGMGPAMAKFIAIVSHKGPVTADYLEQPAPDPAVFGLPAEDDGSRDDVLLGQNLISSTHYEPDFDALRAASTRIVVAVGAESEGELAHRGGVAVAERLGTTPVTFPSGHAGFLGGEYGQMGEPEAFAARLREILAGQA